MAEQSRISFSSGSKKGLNFLKDLEIFKGTVNGNVLFFKVTDIQRNVYDDDVLEDLRDIILERTPKIQDIVFRVVDNRGFFVPSLMVNIKMEVAASEYKGFFISTSRENTSGDCVMLPLLCVTRGNKLVSFVHSMLEQIFGCLILPCVLIQEQIDWILSICTHELVRRNLNEGLKMIFDVPTYGNLIFDLPDKELCTLWKSAHSSSIPTITIEEVKTFKSDLFQYIKVVYGILAEKLRLNSINIDSTFMKLNNGFEVKTTVPELLYCIITYLESGC